tara:strand:+ start:385 stop:516 length:132 start_codon:yes stop_codon:yes gene_type:complete
VRVRQDSGKEWYLPAHCVKDVEDYKGGEVVGMKWEDSVGWEID